MKILIAILYLCFSTFSYADWHAGKIDMIAIGYDGKTISVGLKGTTRTDCTCYSSWPTRYCLDRTRDSFEQEYALLLSAKAKDKSVNINIDETTCKVIAIYER